MVKQHGGRRMAVVTMGCRVNQFESARLQADAARAGYAPAGAGEGADLVVVNTCSVTAESDRQARQAIRRAVRDNPGARVVVTGCYAQRAPAELARIPGVELVLGNAEKGRLGALLSAPPEARVRVGEIQRAPLPEGVALPVQDRARAYLQVQNGCDEGCTFCLIPGVRGGSRSLPLAGVLEQVRALTAAGWRELVLTGINLGAWGREWHPPQGVGALVAAVLAQPGVERLRLSSIDPLDLDAEFIRLLAEEERLCPHLHLSIQAGDDLVLKRMHRRYTRGALLERVAALRAARPGLVLGADLIVGFPTETEEAFANTLALVAEAELSLLHVFRYSDRPGTPASRIPRRFRVPEEEIRARSARLRAAGGAVLERVLARQVERRATLLVERVAEGVVHGKTGHFLPMTVPVAGLPEGPPEAGRLLPVRVVGWQPGDGPGAAVLQGDFFS